MRRDPPADVTARQTLASDPAVSAFVAANAGSGKTHVLVNRVIRLMLAGTVPEKILCITFTKAAAANMAERVFTTLGHWITLDDAALAAEIARTGAETPDRRMLARARELFAQALETPGGLKVQTIHALCTRLLQQFPFEANVAAHFAVLDDRDRADLMEDAMLGVLTQAALAPESAIGRALQHAMTLAADSTFRETVQAACLDGDLLAWLEQAGSVERAVAQLARAVGAQESDDAATLAHAVLNGPYLPMAQWTDAIRMFMTGSSSDQKQAERLTDALAAAGDERLTCYLAVFTTADGPRKSLATKGLREKQPSLAAALESESLRLGPLVERMKAAQLRARNEALLTIVSEVARRYRRAKERRGALDYDDLIGKTLAMLERMPGSWVHYKLDRGIDHVLIDEAQDTSPQQWEIVTKLVGEFFAGEGAHQGAVRTLFAVGDEKQSIFSFQGAVMREFDERRRFFEPRFKAASLKFESVRFTRSFRSGDSVLTAVDATFRDAEVFRSITSDARGMALHEALEDAAPGTVDLWELEEPEDRPDIEGWRAPFDAKPETSPQVRLARRIADHIAGMIGRDSVMHEGTVRPVSAGDILILVRRRGEFFESVIQALKQAHIDVAGADRLKLTEHIAVIDLMALADALLLSRDDLSLAIALKSPLFGLDDDHLMALAPERTGTLREALRAHSHLPPYDAAWARLDACERRAHEKPFSFYAWLLGGEEGRARILRRLGPEANDALDEFLELALAYEQREAATLQGFMNWLRAADIEIKRDMDVARPEVRVMTVHGAKGLEAPIVFLADTTMPPRARDSLIRVAQPDAPADTKPCIVWAGGRKNDPAPFTVARNDAARETTDEYRRLLYVAMTRAAQRLIVGGHRPGNVREVDPNSWYALIRAGLESSGLDVETIETDGRRVRRFRKQGDIELPQARAIETGAPEREDPPWLRRRARLEIEPRRWLRPSDGDDGARHDGGSPAQDGREHAARRGTLVHRLLQSLPDVASDHRAQAAAQFLARNAADWTGEEREALVGHVLSLLSERRFAALFAGGSRAEVPLVGTLARANGEVVNISGQIDRLIVGNEAVLIADFKTNRHPPRTPAAVPGAYLRQMALYRALLKKLYPQRPVRAALVWTETPEIMEISEAALEAELIRITT